jgi:hypothetical protein
MGIMDKQAAEERFFSSLKTWEKQAAQKGERVLEANTDVDGAVDRMFNQLLGRTSIPPM